jgi:Holliday junction resolvase-like predicted endonuclease
MTSTLLSRIRSVLRRWEKSATEAQKGKSLNRKKGATGELQAYHFLRRRGYRIVARNYRTSTGEVDLIGWEDDTLAFVEVKTRLGAENGDPRNRSIEGNKGRSVVWPVNIDPSTVFATSATASTLSVSKWKMVKCASS